jgi:hypothetical protein
MIRESVGCGFSAVSTGVRYRPKAVGFSIDFDAVRVADIVFSRRDLVSAFLERSYQFLGKAWFEKDPIGEPLMVHATG